MLVNKKQSNFVTVNTVTFYSRILRTVIRLAMASSHEDIERKKKGIPLHHTFLYTDGTSEEASLSSSKRVHSLRRERGRVTLCA
jgi:hypothetical protein